MSLIPANTRNELMATPHKKLPNPANPVDKTLPPIKTRLAAAIAIPRKIKINLDKRGYCPTNISKQPKTAVPRYPACV